MPGLKCQGSARPHRLVNSREFEKGREQGLRNSVSVSGQCADHSHSHSRSPCSLISGFIVRRKGEIICKSREVYFWPPGAPHSALFLFNFHCQVAAFRPTWASNLVVGRFGEGPPSGAKAPLIPGAFTARLKSCPFTTASIWPTIPNSRRPPDALS